MQSCQNVRQIIGSVLELLRPECEAKFFGSGCIRFHDELTGEVVDVNGNFDIFDRYIYYFLEIDPETNTVLRWYKPPSIIPFSANLFADMLLRYEGSYCDAKEALQNSYVLLNQFRNSFGIIDPEKVIFLDEVRKLRAYTIYFYIDEYVLLKRAYRNKESVIREMGMAERKRYYKILKEDPESFCYKSCRTLPYNPFGVLSISVLFEFLRERGEPEQHIKEVRRRVLYYQYTLLRGWIESKSNSQNSTRFLCSSEDMRNMQSDTVLFKYLFDERRVLLPSMMPLSPSACAKIHKSPLQLTPTEKAKDHLHACYLVESHTVRACHNIAKLISRIVMRKNRMPPKEVRMKQLCVPKKIRRKLFKKNKFGDYSSDEDDYANSTDEDDDTNTTQAAIREWNKKRNDFNLEHPDMRNLMRADTSYIANDAELGEDQRLALGRCCANDPLVMVTGGPGTGKTSKVLVNVWRSRPLEYLLVATAGIAVNRTVEVIRKIYPDENPRTATIAYVDEVLEHCPNSKLHYTTALIIDEASTIELHQFHRLLKKLPYLQQLVMIGDVDQTSPIGAGYPFRDMMSAFKTRTVRLHCNYRVGNALVHAKNARCLLNVSLLNELRYLTSLPCDPKELSFVVMQSLGSVDENTQHVIDYLRTHFGYEHLRSHTQFIAPYRKMAVQYRSSAKKYIYEEGVGLIHDSHIAVGQRVIFRQNTKQQFRDGTSSSEVFNGETGIVTAITDVPRKGGAEDNKLAVSINNTAEARLSRNKNRWLTVVTSYGYTKKVCMQLLGNTVYDASCITGHSSQGSEYKTVVIILPHYSREVRHILNASLLYTMYTRAKEHVIVIYEEQKASNNMCDSQLLSLGSFVNVACAKRPTINSCLWYGLMREMKNHKL